MEYIFLFIGCLAILIGIYLLGYSRGQKIRDEDDNYVLYNEFPYTKLWKHISDRSDLKDDRNYLVINCKLDMKPLKAYYTEEFDCFLCLESVSLVPINATHYMRIPMSPSNKDI